MSEDEERVDARNLLVRQQDFAEKTRAARHRDTPLGLSFLKFINYENTDPAQALNEGLQLFAEAEQLGFDQGLVRVRHFQPYLSGHISFLSAAARVTSTLRLGTAVIPLHAEDPIRLAEEYQTLDLLCGGRLELGVSAGLPEKGVRSPWAAQITDKEQSWDKLDAFLGHLEGEPIPADEGTFLWGVPEGSPVRVTPPSLGLRSRIAYGAGSAGSVRRAAERGMKLQLSSVTSETGLRFEQSQSDQIGLYRDEFAARGGGETPEVSVSRNILPMTGGSSDAEFERLVRFYTDSIRIDGTSLPEFPVQGRFSHPATGSVDEVIEFLRTDTALAAADNLIVLMPFSSDFDTSRDFLKLIAEEIAPALRPTATTLQEAS